ncbi:MAG: hypothetical protein IKS10_00525 [Lachnospiraceae bacterium]|nr:hypothetical protein [Lachnospiraceae bacterium]
MNKRYWVYAFITSGCLLLALVILWFVGMWNTTLSGSLPWGLYLAYVLLIGFVSSYISGIILWSIHLIQTRRLCFLPFSGALLCLVTAFIVYIIGLVHPEFEGAMSHGLIQLFLIGTGSLFVLGIVLMKLSRRKKGSIDSAT